MNVLILNTHSLLNSGDAGIVLAQVRLIRENLPGAEISLISRTPRLDETVYEPMGLRVLPPLLRAKGLPLGSRSRSDLGRTMAASDLVLASGGGYFYSNRRSFPGRVFLQNVLPVLRASRLGKPIVFLPQSFGPAFSRPARALLSACLAGPSVARIFAREKASLEYLGRLLAGRPNAQKTELCPDVAFALDAPDPMTAGPGDDLPRPLLAVTLRAWDFPGSSGSAESDHLREAYFGTMVETGRRFIARTGGSVLVLPQVRGPWSFEDDRIISRLFAAAVRRVADPARVRCLDLPDAVLPETIMGILGRADAVLATRLHSAIFALRSGRVPVVIGYQPKSAGTMDLLGLGSWCVDISRVDPDRLIGLIDASLEGGSTVSAALDRTAAAGVEAREKVGAALRAVAEGARR
jgi:colanic acid/amylovoran biosynthesis protein